LYKKQRGYVTIRMLMIRNGLTQDELAKKLGMSKSTLNRKLNRKTPWLLDECLLLSNILGVTLDDIFLPRWLPNGNESGASDATNL